MNRFRVTPSVIPNLFTAMNMFSGFLSIVNTSQGKFNYAAWLIIFAAVFDALDGVMARLTKSSSELGVELDSLSDVVSFGAAPAFLLYKSYLFQFNTLGIIISSLLLLAGGFRLARFNIQLVGFDKTFFKGLPIPSAAITVSAFVLAFYHSSLGYSKPYSDVIIPMILILSYLMVSRIKYDTFPKFKFEEIKKNPFLIFLIMLVIVLLFFFTYTQTFFFMFVFIILFGIFRHIFYIIKKKF
jgi:CDP-diacylglycerol---serine O-phosphatidyltransferase